MKDIKNKKELITGVIVTALVTIIAVFGAMIHEPWFDEAQAYVIARDASLHDILFYLPHYEGHPPLWHLLLKAAVMLGLPYELTLKGVQFIIFEIVLIIIEFRSPYSKTAKILIPMSFFMLYQYCIIARPYILLILAALLAAMFYKERKQKPVRYMISLVFLCLTHSYGIAFAGGIVIGDIIGECIREKSFKKTASDIIKNRRLLVSYVILLAAAAAIIIDIVPSGDTFAMNAVQNKKHSFPAILFFSWFLIPSENFFTSFSSEMLSMQQETNPVSEIISAAVISLLIWSCLFIICKKRRMIAEMLIPYLFISILTSTYIYPHHFGIFLTYLLFILWTAEAKEKVTFEKYSSVMKKAGVSEKLAKMIAVAGAALYVCINLYWNGMSYYNDVKYPYDPSREIAEWIKKYDLYDKSFLAAWTGEDTNMYTLGSTGANAYFDNNIYYNMHDGLAYVTHIVPDEQEYEKDIEAMKAHGDPDFILCGSVLASSSICDTLGIDEHYVAVALEARGERIFKDKKCNVDVCLVCTRDTYKELYGKEYEVQTYKNS